jgi:hypothetical protein
MVTSCFGVFVIARLADKDAEIKCLLPASRSKLNNQPTELLQKKIATPLFVNETSKPTNVLWLTNRPT